MIFVPQTFTRIFYTKGTQDDYMLVEANLNDNELLEEGMYLEEVLRHIASTVLVVIIIAAANHLW